MDINAMTALAGGTFSDLSDAERRLLRAAVEGIACQLPPGSVVRPALVRWLCTDPEAKNLVEPHGLWLENVTIPGDLDLRNINIDFLLRLHHLIVEGDVDLRDARVRSVGLRGTSCRTLSAQRARISGDLFLDSESDGHGLVAEKVSLMDSDISGNLLMTGARIGDPLIDHQTAVELKRARIGGSVALQAPTQVRGSLDAMDTHIGGHFAAEGASIERQHNASQPALVLVRARIAGSVFLNSAPGTAAKPTTTRTVIRGGASLWGANVGGLINCSGLMLHEAEPRESKAVDQRAGEHDIVPKNDVRPPILDLSAVEVGQDIVCNGLFIDKMGASPKQDEATRGQGADDAPANARATPPHRSAPTAEIVGTRIRGQLYWRPLLPRDSVVALSRSRVGSFLYHLDAWPTWPDTGQVWPDTGQVWLDGFRYDEILSDYSSYRRPRLSAFARRLGADPDAPKQHGWRGVLSPALALDETHLSLVRRHTQHTYDPQPYDTLATALRSMGRQGDATKVLMAKVNDGRRTRWRRLLGLPYRLLVGNGYDTWRGVVWLVVAVILGTLLFGAAYDRGEILPVKSANEVLPFQPLAYSLDTLLPFLDLQLDDTYLPNGPRSVAIRRYLWVHTGFGWVLAAAVTAAAGAALRRTS